MHSNDAVLPVNLAILQRSGEIASINDAWKRFARQNGLLIPRFGLGTNYLEHCKATDPEASRGIEQIGALLRGETGLVSFAYRCDSPDKKRAFVLIGAPLAEAPDAGVALLHLDIGKMLRSAGPGEIATAVERTTSQVLAAHLAQMSGAADENGAPGPASLTGTERMVLKLLGQGKTNKEIAALLLRSPNTIKIHVSNILKKLNLRSRTEAAVMGFKFGHWD